MKKLLIILCLIVCYSCNNEKLPKEDGLVFKLLVESNEKINVSTCTDATAYRIQNNSKFNNRIVVGSFRDYWDARQLKICLRKAGNINTMVIAYEDGERVSLSDL